MEWFDSAVKLLGERITEGPALAFLILTLALIAGPNLAEKVRLPAMVGLVLAGMLVGPHGLRALDTDEIALSAWGTFGLLYLMFAAGLELDLKMFARMKKAGLTFAVLSFIIPCSLGIFSARLLGYNWDGAILMGSNWGSHTLVTYPLLRQMGLARNRAVGTVVAATAVTDTSALLVLTGVTASHGGIGGGVGWQALEIVVGLLLLAAWTLLALPKIARWFFSHVGNQGTYRFVFGTVALMSGAVIAQLASIDGIVGAFFAGLGLIRSIPERSVLMERVQFFGSALFIPVFLVSVGILLDPEVLTDPKTLWIAFVFTVAVLGGKAMAAVLAGKTFHFTWSEIGVMSGLSGSQAAATLATTLVGAKLGIFDKQTINAVLVVILLTLIATPAMVSYFGKRVTRVTKEAEAMGGIVMVPMLGESTRPLLGMAGKLAASDGGIVLAASIASSEAPDSELAKCQALSQKAEDWLAKEGLESKSLFRVSSSSAQGLWDTLRGEHATMLLSEWKHPWRTQSEGEDEAFRLVRRAMVPVVLAHGPLEHFGRLVVVENTAVDGDTAAAQSDLDVAAEVASRLAEEDHQVAYVGGRARHAEALFHTRQPIDRVETNDPIGWARDHGEDDDLVILSGLGAVRDAFERFPELIKGRFMVAIATHRPTAAAAE